MNNVPSNIQLDLVSRLKEYASDDDDITARFGQTTNRARAMREAADEIIRLRSELEKAYGIQWQLTKTAPTDGTEFLAYTQHIGMFVGTILTQEHPDCDYDGGVHCSWDHGYIDGVTFWMPLPPKPKAKT